ncbi:MAG: molybdopterin-synthase adenylyltransferase MoeB [Bdellovibrio sp.]|nr:molybdopterin-synthase adenylyltransferase MoeB [Bdellovibrio sp.]
MPFSSDQQQRYARHLILPEVGPSGQEKLQKARVLVIGAGGLGSPIALYLAAAGVGCIGLIDDDQVSLANLQRQILYTTDDVSKNKADTAQKRLFELNPTIEIKAIHARFTKENAAECVAGYDIVVDGSDNFSTRYIVNEACIVAKKPLVFGAIYRFDGQISVFGLNNGPCYRCLYPEAPAAEAAPGCSESGVLGVLPGVIGTLMATEVLKIILNIGIIMSGKIMIYDALSAHFQTLGIKRRADCKTCGENSVQYNLISETKESIKEGLQPKELLALLDQAYPPYVLDVRNEEEFVAFNLPRSTNIPLAQLSKKLSEIPRNAPVIVVCQSGVRSARALEILTAAGIIDVRHLSDGLQALKFFLS